MSFEAMLWATTAAPVADVNEYAVLCAMGERADMDGCNAFCALATYAEHTKADTRTVIRVMNRMEERGVIALGDQSAAQYIRADRRPPVYDLMIPFSWLAAQSTFDRVKKFRASKGRPVLTVVLRPDLGSAPEKKKRADAGRKRAARGDLKSGGNSDEVTSSPDEVTSSPARGDLKSATGCLEVTRTFTTDPVLETTENLLAGGRRPTTGSRADGFSGFAAPPEDQAGQVPAEHVRAVVAGLPEPVRTALGKASRHAPLNITTTVRGELLRGLSVQRLIERAGDRWHVRGYVDDYRDGKIRRPVGVADALLRNDCTSSRCDDGIDIDTGQKCRTCERARDDRRPPTQSDDDQGAA